MPRKTRISKDEDALVTAISKHVPLFSSLSIRDCVQLGKYKADSRPRPILATPNKPADVNCVLSTRFPQDGLGYGQIYHPLLERYELFCWLSAE